MAYSEDINSIARQIQAVLAHQEVGEDLSIEWSSVPFHHQWGIGTSVCFRAAALLSHTRKENIPVPQLAQQLASQIASEIKLPEGFSRIEAVRGYINIFYNSKFYVGKVLHSVLGSGVEYGKGAAKNETVMVEYAQPNTHHSIHIGHFRNAVLGESLARLMEFAGFKTIRAAYPGDIGMGVIRCMWAYQRFHQGEEPTGTLERGRWLAQLYTEATTLLEPNPEDSEKEKSVRESYDNEVREMYRLWDIGDTTVRDLWHRTRQWSLDELHEILKQLDIRMDVFFYESEADLPGKEIVRELIDRNIAEDERLLGGPVIVKIDEKLGIKSETYRTAVVLRSDGTSLYLTKDLALAKIKFEKYHVDRSIYVVDARQSLHFQQVFKILELLGFPQASKCFHLTYEIVTLPEGTMSSRKGTVVYFIDVAQEAIQRIRDIIQEKNPSLSGAQRDQTAHQIALGALKYAMLSVDNTKQIVFSWKDALDFEGQSAPYIQYAHVRAASILGKFSSSPSPVIPQYELTNSEITLMDWISRFPDEVQRSAKDYKPLHLANYAYALAKAFTDFYMECPVLQAETGVKETRLAIVGAAKQTIANSLRLLGIEAPQSM